MKTCTNQASLTLRPLQIPFLDAGDLSSTWFELSDATIMIDPWTWTGQVLAQLPGWLGAIPVYHQVFATLRFCNFSTMACSITFRGKAKAQPDNIFHPPYIYMRLIQLFNTLQSLNQTPR